MIGPVILSIANALAVLVNDRANGGKEQNTNGTVGKVLNLLMKEWKNAKVNKTSNQVENIRGSSGS